MVLNCDTILPVFYLGITLDLNTISLGVLIINTQHHPQAIGTDVLYSRYRTEKNVLGLLDYRLYWFFAILFRVEANQVLRDI